ncbi:MAG: PAS domain S-box protein, partial [Desulfobacterales bacterium]
MAKKPTYKELETQNAALKKEVAEYKKIERVRKNEGDPELVFFEDSPIAQTEIDCSRLKGYFDELRESGVTDFHAFFEENEAALDQCLDHIKLIRANEASHKLFHTKKNEDYSKRIVKYVKDKVGLGNFGRGMAAMAEGRTEFQGERAFRPGGRESIYVHTFWRVAPGSETTLSKVYTANIDITRRKEAELFLQQSEEKYRALYDNAIVAMFTVTIDDGVPLDVNDAGVALWGYASKEEFFSEFRAEKHYVQPGGRKRFVERLQKEGEVRIEEGFFHRKDGTRFWAEANIKLNLKEGFLECVAVDITERVQAREALQRSEEHLTIAQEIAGIGSFEFDGTTGEVTASDGVYRILGLAPQSVPFTRELFETLVHPDDRDRVRDGWDPKGTGTKQPAGDLLPFQSVVRLVRPDNSQRKVLVRTDIRPDGSGQTVRTLGVFADLTNIIHGQNMLATQGQVLDNMMESVMVVDGDRNIIYTNPAFDGMFGYPPERLVGQSAAVLDVATDANILKRKEMLEAMETTGRWHGKTDAVKRDGTPIVAAVHLSSVKIEERTHFIIVQEDITERERLAKALK